MKIFAAIAITGLLVVSGSAAERQQQIRPPRPAGTPKVVEASAEQTAEPSPTPKRRKFLGIPLGKKEQPAAPVTPSATPVASPSPAPAPSPSPAVAPTPTPAASATPESSPTPAAKKGRRVAPTPTPTPAATPEKAQSEAPVAQEKAPTPAPAVKETPAPAPTDPFETERQRYKEVRRQALEDPQVRELQDKVDSALDEQAHKEAGKNYYKALFGKIRQIDPSLTERADALEAKALEQLEKSQ